jgi:hypothetical protein
VLNYLTQLYQLGALPVIRPVATQVVTVGPVSSASAAVAGNVVRLLATVDCNIAIGPAPVADGNSLRLSANVPEYFACNATDQVAVIQSAAAGQLFVTPAV